MFRSYLLTAKKTTISENVFRARFNKRDSFNPNGIKVGKSGTDRCPGPHVRCQGHCTYTHTYEHTNIHGCTLGIRGHSSDFPATATAEKVGIHRARG